MLMTIAAYAKRWSAVLRDEVCRRCRGQRGGMFEGNRSPSCMFDSPRRLVAGDRRLETLRQMRDSNCDGRGRDHLRARQTFKPAVRATKAGAFDSSESLCQSKDVLTVPKCLRRDLTG